LSRFTCVIANIDDIIIFSKNEDEHKRHVWQLFERLNNFGVGINVSKCQFGKNEIEFSGHIVSSSCIKPVPSKVEATQQFSLPKMVKQLHRYFGMLQYYPWFILQTAQKLILLNNLLRGKVKGNKVITWSTDTENAFYQSKALLADASLLVFSDYDLPMSVMVDASDLAIGGVLQVKIKGVWSPVAFFSRHLDKTQSKFSAFDRE